MTLFPRIFVHKFCLPRASSHAQDPADRHWRLLWGANCQVHCVDVLPRLGPPTVCSHWCQVVVRQHQEAQRSQGAYQVAGAKMCHIIVAVCASPSADIAWSIVDVHAAVTSKRLLPHCPTTFQQIWQWVQRGRDGCDCCECPSGGG